MIAAPTFSQIKAQVAGIRQKLPDARVIGIHAQGRWTGERQQFDGEQLYLIQQCDSPLAMRLALREGKVDNAIQVLITPLLESELEEDILLRFAKQRLFAPGSLIFKRGQRIRLGLGYEYSPNRYHRAG